MENKIFKTLFLSILSLTIISSNAYGSIIDTNTDANKQGYIEFEGELVPEVVEPLDGTVFTDSEIPDTFIVQEGNRNSELISPRSATTNRDVWKKAGSGSIVKGNGFLRFHPDFPKYQYNINSYGFGSSYASISTGVSLNSTYISVSVSYTPKGSINFSTIPSDPKRWGRPAIYGKIRKVPYTVTTYSPVGTVLRTRTEYLHFSESTYNITVYK